MRALLSVVGTRGDVHPVLALALQLRALGHDARLCIPPNFLAEAAAMGFEAHPVGVEMRPGAPAPPSGFDLIQDQFTAVLRAAIGCDIILGANAHQYGAASIAEVRGVPYVNVLFAPTALPTAVASRAWNERARDRVNANRARLALPPVDDVLGHIVTDAPWLAADIALTAGVGLDGRQLTHTGAWRLPDAAPLPDALRAFLDAGDPPVYVGFGSMPLLGVDGAALLAAARAVGRRLVVARGWGGLSTGGAADDVFELDEANHALLFPRVAVVVHHGGAGTTHAAALAGTPQLVLPMYGDQHYWGERIGALGLGCTLQGPARAETLAEGLRTALVDACVARAVTFAGTLVRTGAHDAARRLIVHAG